MMDNHISFEIDEITKEEIESDNYKKLYNNINLIFEKFLGTTLTEYNALKLFSEIENIVLDYKYNNPNSTLKIRPNHEYAFRKQILTVKELKTLHKKYCKEIHVDKKTYNKREVNNMLFDLQTIGQIFSYEPVMFCYEEGENEFKGFINAKVRIFQYI